MQNGLMKCRCQHQCVTVPR